VGQVQLLLANGASVRLGDQEGNTPLIRAAEFVEIDVGDGHEEERYAQILRVLLDAGANVRETNRLGKTALMAAAYAGHERLFHLLLSRGAQADARDRRGRTALTWAAWRGKEDALVQELLALHLPVGLTEALLFSDAEMARQRLAAGGDWHVYGPHEETA